MSVLEQPLRVDGLLWLSRPVSHPEHGNGYISAEEMEGANTGRTLRATFASESFRGDAYDFRREGIKLRGARLYSGPRVFFQYPDHHGAKCAAHDEAPLRLQLRAEAELRAA